jgi:hypothetical protein
MKSVKKNEDSFKIIEIVENVTVVYTDGSKELFQGVYMNDKGVVLGRIMKIEKTNKDLLKGYTEEFIGYGFIPKTSYKDIEDGLKRQIVVQNNGIIKF